FRYFAPPIPRAHSLSSSLPLSLDPPFLFFHVTPLPELFSLSLHDALPISRLSRRPPARPPNRRPSRAPRHRPPAPRLRPRERARSEEHTSELQSHLNLVCRLLPEKKNIP